VTATPPRPALLWGVVGLCLAALAAALLTQHGLGMQPCAWCVLQLLIFLCIALSALIGLAWRAAPGQALSALLMLGLSLSGVAAALWQHFVAAASTSCNLALADRIISGLGLDGSLPEIFQPRASCAEAAVKLLGVPYEFWSLALFTLLAIVSLRMLMRRRG
jgi:disulfide bond formation protein DsbB